MADDHSQIRILIVDDLADNRMLLRLDLEDELNGATIHEAKNGREALERICVNKYSVIVCDFMMPGMNGFELFEAVKHRCTPDDMPPFIFLSANKQKEVAEEGLRIGAIDFMTKPYELSELIFKVTNLSRIKLLNDSLKKSKTELEEANKKLEQLNKEKDDVLRIVSHDMKNPLNVIQGISDLLQNCEYTDHQISKMGAVIHRNSNKMLDLVNNLLEVARVESGNISLNVRPFDLVSLLTEIVEGFQLKADNKNIALRMSCPKHSLPVKMDATRLEQIVNNLLSNAIKFTAAGGIVNLELIHKAACIEIKVSDTGIGIAKEKLPSLFKKFSEHQRPGTNMEEGSGLGLYIVKQLTDLLGGKVKVKSAIDEGTTFILTFEKEKLSI